MIHRCAEFEPKEVTIMLYAMARLNLRHGDMFSILNAKMKSFLITAKEHDYIFLSTSSSLLAELEENIHVQEFRH